MSLRNTLVTLVSAGGGGMHDITAVSPVRVLSGANEGYTGIDVTGMISASTKLSAAEIALGGVNITATGAEINYVDGVTSAIQTQIDAKHATIDSSNRLNANLIHDGSISNTEFGYLNNVTHNVQTQLIAASANLSPLAGSTSIVTVGTIDTGTWHGTAIGDTYIASSSDWNTGYSAKINSAALGTDSILTLTRQDAGTVTVNLAALSGHAFKTISVDGQSDIVADTTADTLSAMAGSNMTITTRAGTDTIIFAATDTNTTYTAGSGLELFGTEFSHENTSSQASSDNSGRTYIQDITLDTYGHVTGIATAAETVTDTTYTAGTLLDLSTTTFNVDLTEAAAATIANGDYVIFLDGGTSGAASKGDVHDVANLFAGTGLTASSSVIGVDASQTQITGLGTVTTGTWSTGAVIAGATMTLGSDATGDMYYRNGSGVLTRIGVGSDNHVLTLDGTTPGWEAASGGGGSGSMTTIASGGTQVGGSDIVTLDFSSNFTITESPDTEINIDISPGIISDLTDVTSTDSDYLLLWDATDSTLKKVDAGWEAASGGGGSSEWTDTGSVLHPADSSGTADAVVVGGTTAGNSDIVFNTDGSAVFNEQSASVDFRVESNGNANMLFVDGSADAVGIGTSAPTAELTVSGEVSASGGFSSAVRPMTNHTSSAIVTYDITGPALQTLVLANNQTNTYLGTESLPIGKTVTWRISANGDDRTLVWHSSMKFVGEKPTTIGQDKVALLSITTFGTLCGVNGIDTDVVCAYAVED